MISSTSNLNYLNKPKAIHFQRRPFSPQNQTRQPKEHNYSQDIDKILNGTFSKAHNTMPTFQRKSSKDHQQVLPFSRMKSSSPVRIIVPSQQHSSFKFQEDQSEQIPSYECGNLFSKQITSIKRETISGSNSKTNKSAKNQSKQPIGQSVNGMIYFLGKYADDLLDIIEKKEEKTNIVNKLIERMRLQEFLEFQNKRMKSIQAIFKQFFYSISLSNSQSKAVHEEITQTLSEEISDFGLCYDQFAIAMHERFSKLNAFKENDVILITDFYQGVEVLLETYSFFIQGEEQGESDKTKQLKNIKMNSVNQFKFALEADPRKQKIKRLFEQLENLLQRNYERIQSGIAKINNLVDENTKLTNMCKTLQDARSQISSQIFQNHNLNVFNSNLIKLIIENNQLLYGQDQSNKQLITAQQSQKQDSSALQEYFQQTIESLQAKNKELSECIQKQTKRINLLSILETSDKERKEVLQKKQLQEIKNSKIKIKSLADSQIQCVIEAEVVFPVKKLQNLSQIFQNPLIYLRAATVQPKEWVQMVVNSILSDKLISDVLDDLDQRPTTSFQTYLCEWFMIKFGSQYIAELLLKDFLLSLKKYCALSERFMIFCKLCCLDELLETENNIESLSQSFSIGINKRHFKKEYSKCQDGLIIILKVAYLIRITNKNYFGTTNNQPLFPNILHKSLDLISNDLALKICQKIFEEEGIDKTDSFSVENNFKKIVEEDIESRKCDALGIYSSPTDDQEEGFIRFDTLCRNILELVANQRFLELESLYLSLKLKANSVSECCIGFKDFQSIIFKLFPWLSQRWTEIAFREFNQGVLSEKTLLSEAIIKLIPLLLNEDCMRSNFLSSKISELLKTETKVDDKDDLQLEIPSIAKLSFDNSQTKSIQNISKEVISLKATNQKNSKNNNKKNQNVTLKNDNKGSEIITQLYDSVSQMGLLEETYLIFGNLIKQGEKKQPNIVSLHSSFKEDLQTLPQSVIKQVRYEQFDEKNKEEMVETIEKAWDKFRKLISTLKIQ